MGRLEIRILGPPRIDVDGAPFDVDTRKAVALLAYVALEGAQTRDRLAALLWPESDTARARAALRRTLSVCGRALEGRWLRADRRRVILEGEWWCDATDLRRTVAACEAHDHARGIPSETCVAALGAATDHYTGDLLEGFSLRDSPPFDEWQSVTAEGLRRDLAHALERVVRGHVAAGRLEAATDRARRQVAVDPLHEPAHRRLMLLYAWTDRRGDAVAQYRDCVATLERELGVRPLDETTDLYRAILEDRAPPPPDTSRDVTVGAPGAPSVAVRTTVPTTRAGPAPRLLPLVGRDDAVASLVAGHAAIGAAGRLLAVTGEAGIGKTRLVDEVQRRLVAQGVTWLGVRCHPGDRQLAYAPVAEALRRAGADAIDASGVHGRTEAARLVPDLTPGVDAGDLEPLTSPGATLRFVEGICQVLAAAVDGTTPGVLAVDDLHFADDASLDLLAYLASRLRTRPLGLLVAWRDEDLPAAARWRAAVADLAREGLAVEVPLARLARPAVASLVDASPVDGDAATVARLHDETEGLPLAVVAYLDELARTPGDDWPVPRGLQQLFRARLDALAGIPRQILTTAAVIGRSFDLATVVAASGRTEDETIEALEDLVRRRIIREVAPAVPADAERDDTLVPDAVYDFVHDKLRSVAYDRTGVARRRLLHRRVADALRQRAHGRPLDVTLAGRIARHEFEAGRIAEAAAMHVVAGRRARALHANREALEHLRRAVTLGHPDEAALLEAVGDLETLAGDYRGALASYAAAAASTAGPALATLERKAGLVHLRVGDIAAAATRLDAAAGSLGADPAPRAVARLHADRSLVATHAGRHADAEREARQALAVAERSGDRRALAQARNILGILARRAARPDEARRQLEISADLAAQLRDPDARIAALNNLALALGDAGEYDHAIEHATTAVELCARLGDVHREAALHNNLADLFHAAGEEDRAMAHLKRAVALFASIGEEATRQPEIWQLTEW